MSNTHGRTTKGAKDTPLTTEQRELAARYFGFSQAEAVTVCGDDEDARDIGTQALPVPLHTLHANGYA